MARLLCIGPPAEAAACARAAERAGYRAARATPAEAAAQLAELRPDAVLVWSDDEAEAALEAVRAAEGKPLLVLVGEPGDAAAKSADAVIAQAGDPALMLAEVDALLAGHKPQPAASTPDALSAIDQVLDGEMQTLWSQITTTPAPDIPHWRAATQVLAKKAPEPPAAGNTEPGAFAAHVRQTLSAIEQRLFPDSPPQTSLATPPVDDVLREIDLDALGAAAMPVPEFDVNFDEEDTGVPLITPPTPNEPAAAHVSVTPAVPVAEPPPPPAPVPVPEPLPEAALVPVPAPAAAPVAEPEPELDPTVASRPVHAPEPLPDRGDLLEHDLPRLLHRIHREGFTGRLRLRHGGVEKSLYFEQGQPVYATSSLPQDRMGDLLYREGKITRAQLDETRRMAEESGRRVGQLLVDLKFLKASELFPTVRRHVEDILYSLFAWSQGEFELTPAAEPPADQKVRLLSHPDHLIVEGIRRKVDLERLVDQVGPGTTRPSPLSPDLAAALCDVYLDDDERALLPLVDGARAMADLVREGALDEVRVYQLAYGLAALGLVRLDRPEGDTLTDWDENTPTGVVGQPVGPASEAALAIDRERIFAKHAACSEGDYFSVLGLRSDASDHEIRRAWDEQRREFSATRFAPELREACATQLREIAEVLAEAWAVLSDRTLRNAYRSYLRDAG